MNELYSFARHGTSKAWALNLIINQSQIVLYIFVSFINGKGEDLKLCSLACSAGYKIIGGKDAIWEI